MFNYMDIPTKRMTKSTQSTRNANSQKNDDEDEINF